MSARRRWIAGGVLGSLGIASVVAVLYARRPDAVTLALGGVAVAMLWATLAGIMMLVERLRAPR